VDEIAICAAGESAWHAAAYAGLGFDWRVDDGFAWGPGGPAHRFLLSGVTVEVDARPPGGFSNAARGLILDSWAVFTNEDLPGWTSSLTDPWMIRHPGPCEIPAVEGVEVESTDDELLFERTAFVGAGGSPPADPGELHPPGSSGFDGLHMLLARRGETPVGTAIAVQHQSGTVISGVGVVAAERRKGIGALLTATAIAVDPTVPATLTASDLGIGVYRRLGFREVGLPWHWTPPAEQRLNRSAP
jgi:GNAT superfamily N-acetyltransferase